MSEATGGNQGNQAPVAVVAPALAFPDKTPEQNALIEKHRLSNGLLIDSPASILASGGLSDDEIAIRKDAILALTEIYNDLNTNSRSHEEAQPYYKYSVPGWYPIPANPDDLGITDPTALKYYRRHRNFIFPRFNQPLAEALAVFKTPEASVTWEMECTIAAFVAEYAILAKVLPAAMANNFIKTAVLDNSIALNPGMASVIKGYEGRDIAKANTLLATGSINQDTHDNMIFDAKKAQRLIIAYEMLESTLYKPQEPQTPNSKLLAGDMTYIWGHPHYILMNPAGMYRGENVFCAGYTNKGLKTFLGYGKNFLTGPKLFKEVQKWLAYEHLGQHQVPAGSEEAYAENMRRVIENHATQGSAFLRAFAAVRSNPKSTPISVLNIARIQVYKSQAGGRRSGKTQRRRRVH